MLRFECTGFDASQGGIGFWLIYLNLYIPLKIPAFGKGFALLAGSPVQ